MVKPSTGIGVKNSNVVKNGFGAKNVNAVKKVNSLGLDLLSSEVRAKNF